MDQQVAKYVIVAGVLLAIAGIVMYFFHDKLQWIGRLPGDIRITRDHFNFYFPVTTMILFSVLLTLIIYVVRRFL